MPRSFCLWCTTSCADWPPRSCPRRSPGKLSRPRPWSTRHTSGWLILGKSAPWDNRVHFLAAAAEAMRRILIDRARDRKRLKRGGERRRQDLDLESLLEDDAPADDLIDLDDAIARLNVIDAEAAALVKLRLFAGLTIEQAALALGLSRRTAERDWTFARTWLFGHLGPHDEPA